MELSKSRIAKLIASALLCERELRKQTSCEIGSVGVNSSQATPRTQSKSASRCPLPSFLA